MNPTKKERLINAIKNPPPERLAQIEYRSHLLQAFGIAVVCIFLIMKGFWYIIFAFIFGIGISYSQGMSALMKYRNILALKQPETLKDYESDISPTRRRSKIISSVMGKWAGWVSVIISVVTTVLIIDPSLSRWILSILYPIIIIALYIFYYYFVLYWITYPIYKRRLKK